MQLVRLIERNEAGFPSFSRGIMVASLQICGIFARLKEALSMASSSFLASGPRAFRNEGGVVWSCQSLPSHFLDGSF